VAAVALLAVARGAGLGVEALAVLDVDGALLRRRPS
jgi:hypothetical protein